MATTIIQEPAFGRSTTPPMPVGQKILFSVKNNSVVNNNFNVKFVAEVYVHTTVIAPGTGSTGFNVEPAGTFKTTPNNAGVGIFDFQSILESFVSSDNEPGRGDITEGISKFKTYAYNSSSYRFPIHVIDTFSQSRNAIRYFGVFFYIEGSSTATGSISQIANTTAAMLNYVFFNGVLQHDNYLTLKANTFSASSAMGYGYDLIANNLCMSATTNYPNQRFLSNAPTVQYANKTDYGTFSYIQALPIATTNIGNIVFTWYNASGSQLGTLNYFSSTTAGASTGAGGTGAVTFAPGKLLYFGGFPGNLRNHSSAFESDIDNISYYTITPELYQNGVKLVNQKTYTVYINCPDLRGYESVRLAWLNQWGTWDYYTFTKKSTRSTTTNRTTYTQSTGTWNEETFAINGYKGGRKNFRVNSTERFQINTDFLTEEEGAWMENLMNSPEVYIINGFDSSEVAPASDITNKYAEPVLITTSNYIRKTIANDKLIQYTFDIERNKTQRTQTV